MSGKVSIKENCDGASRKSKLPMPVSTKKGMKRPNSESDDQIENKSPMKARRQPLVEKNSQRKIVTARMGAEHSKLGIARKLENVSTPSVLDQKGIEFEADETALQSILDNTGIEQPTSTAAAASTAKQLPPRHTLAGMTTGTPGKGMFGKPQEPYKKPDFHKWCEEYIQRVSMYQPAAKRRCEDTGYKFDGRRQSDVNFCGKYNVPNNPTFSSKPEKDSKKIGQRTSSQTTLSSFRTPGRLSLAAQTPQRVKSKEVKQGTGGDVWSSARASMGPPAKLPARVESTSTETSEEEIKAPRLSLFGRPSLSSKTPGRVSRPPSDAVSSVIPSDTTVFQGPGRVLKTVTEDLGFSRMQTPRLSLAAQTPSRVPITEADKDSFRMDARFSLSAQVQGKPFGGVFENEGSMIAPRLSLAAQTPGRVQKPASGSTNSLSGLQAQTPGRVSLSMASAKGPGFDLRMNLDGVLKDSISQTPGRVPKKGTEAFVKGESGNHTPLRANSVFDSPMYTPGRVPKAKPSTSDLVNKTPLRVLRSITEAADRYGIPTRVIKTTQPAVHTPLRVLNTPDTVVKQTPQRVAATQDNDNKHTPQRVLIKQETSGNYTPRRVHNSQHNTWNQTQIKKAIDAPETIKEEGNGTPVTTKQNRHENLAESRTPVTPLQKLRLDNSTTPNEKDQGVNCEPSNVSAKKLTPILKKGTSKSSFEGNQNGKGSPALTTDLRSMWKTKKSANKTPVKRESLTTVKKRTLTWADNLESCKSVGHKRSENQPRVESTSTETSEEEIKAPRLSLFGRPSLSSKTPGRVSRPPSDAVSSVIPSDTTVFQGPGRVLKTVTEDLGFSRMQTPRLSLAAQTPSRVPITEADKDSFRMDARFSLSAQVQGKPFGGIFENEGSMIAPRLSLAAQTPGRVQKPASGSTNSLSGLQAQTPGRVSLSMASAKGPGFDLRMNLDGVLKDSISQTPGRVPKKGTEAFVKGESGNHTPLRANSVFDSPMYTPGRVPKAKPSTSDLVNKTPLRVLRSITEAADRYGIPTRVIKTTQPAVHTPLRVLNTPDTVVKQTPQRVAATQDNDNKHTPQRVLIKQETSGNYTPRRVHNSQHNTWNQTQIKKAIDAPETIKEEGNGTPVTTKQNRHENLAESRTPVTPLQKLRLDNSTTPNEKDQGVNCEPSNVSAKKLTPILKKGTSKSSFEGNQNGKGSPALTTDLRSMWKTKKSANKTPVKRESLTTVKKRTLTWADNLESCKSVGHKRSENQPPAKLSVAEGGSGQSGGSTCSSTFSYTDMVSSITSNDFRTKLFVTEGKPNSHPPNIEPTTSSNENVAGCFQDLRRQICSKGISNDTADILLASWRPGTKKQYGTYLRKWMLFCEQQVNPFNPSVACFLNFLTNLHKTGLGYSAINTAKSAVSSVVYIVSGFQIGVQMVVKQFMRGVYNERPALPRYNCTWDVSLVLKYLATLFPLNEIPLKLLSYKLLMLLALTTGQRLQTLQVVDVRNCENTDHYLKIRIGDLLKQSKAGHHLHEIYIESYKDSSICVVHTFQKYLELTSAIRDENTQLFISFQRPYNSVTKSTLSTWIKATLKLAGIDIGMFSPHSTRSASTSAASTKIPIDTVLRTAGWKKDCTFRKFYNRQVKSDSSFSLAILESMNTVN